MDYNEYLNKYVSYDPILFRRCWAATIDYILYFTIFILYGYFFGDVHAWWFNINSDSIDYKFNVEVNFISWSALWFIYFPLSEAIFGYTPGKGIFDLKVIKERKNDFMISVTFKRHLLDVIDFFLFGIVAILMVKYSVEHKRIGDILAHSRVVLDE